jgi:hypothetical protein
MSGKGLREFLSVHNDATNERLVWRLGSRVGANDGHRGGGETTWSPERESALDSWGIVPRQLLFVNSVFPCTAWSFERRGLVRMGVGEVAGMEGVGGGVSGLIRVWKCVENSISPVFDKPNRKSMHAARAARRKNTNIRMVRVASAFRSSGRSGPRTAGNR